MSILDITRDLYLRIQVRQSFRDIYYLAGNDSSQIYELIKEVSKTYEPHDPLLLLAILKDICESKPCKYSECQHGLNELSFDQKTYPLTYLCRKRLFKLIPQIMDLTFQQVTSLNLPVAKNTLTKSELKSRHDLVKIQEQTILEAKRKFRDPIVAVRFLAQNLEYSYLFALKSMETIRPYLGNKASTPKIVDNTCDDKLIAVWFALNDLRFGYMSVLSKLTSRFGNTDLRSLSSPTFASYRKMKGYFNWKI